MTMKKPPGPPTRKCCFCKAATLLGDFAGGSMCMDCEYILGNMEEAHRDDIYIHNQDYLQDPARLARIEKYTRRADAELPLFEEDRKAVKAA